MHTDTQADIQESTDIICIHRHSHTKRQKHRSYRNTGPNEYPDTSILSSNLCFHKQKSVTNPYTKFTDLSTQKNADTHPVLIGGSVRILAHGEEIVIRLGPNICVAVTDKHKPRQRLATVCW
jgi:hypothetical protein